jgi:hypothetical protein
MDNIIFDGVSIDKIDSAEELVDPYEGHTTFAQVYNRFLGKITDDMYMELTPEDTLRDLQNLLINAIPGFEFPRVIIDEFIINTIEVPTEELTNADFVIGTVDLEGKISLVERSYFASQLSSEEINILAILMMEGWVQRQITSVEVTRMKYSGPDFKMTS